MRWRVRTVLLTGAAILTLLVTGNIAAEARARKPTVVVAGTAAAASRIVPLALEHAHLTCVEPPLNAFVVAERVTHVWREPAPDRADTSAPDMSGISARVEFYSLFGVRIASATAVYGAAVFCGRAAGEYTPPHR